MSLYMRLPFAVGVALACATSAHGHGDHGGGGGTVLPAGITIVTADIDVAAYKPISDARLSELAAAGRDGIHSLKSIAVPSVSISRGITSGLTLAVRIPYLANQELRETDTSLPGVAARGGVYGFGDISATATYRFIKATQAGFEASAIVGLKAPTGRTDAVDKMGLEFETEHQPGSGSWDPIVGLAGSVQVDGLSGNAITLSASTLYTFAGDGDRQTTLGDKLSYGLTASTRVWTSTGGPLAMALGGPVDAMMHHGGPHEQGDDGHGGHGHGDAPSSPTAALDVSLGLNGEWHGTQNVAGLSDPNTGGHVLYVTPGVALSVDRWTAQAAIGIPVATQINGVQSAPDWRMNTSIAVRF